MDRPPTKSEYTKAHDICMGTVSWLSICIHTLNNLPGEDHHKGAQFMENELDNQLIKAAGYEALAERTEI